MYQGSIFQVEGVDKLIDIFNKLERKGNKQALVLLVYGENIESLKDKIKDSKNIYWHDKVSSAVYMEYVASADWGIYLMENTCKNHNYALPNKIFDYIAGGLPLILSNLKEMGDFVVKNKVGYVMEPNDISKVVLLLSSIGEESKSVFKNNLQTTSKKYCWGEQEKVLLKIYNSI